VKVNDKTLHGEILCESAGKMRRKEIRICIMESSQCVVYRLI